MNRKFWIFAVGFLLASSLACSALSGGSKTPATEVPPIPNSNGGAEATQPPSGGEIVQATATTEAEAPGSFDTEFPLPPEVSNFMDTGNDSINFQTTMSLKDAIAFYREAFAKAGYKEREINTAITDATFSMVFDGHANGKAIVIQGVDLGGSTNINIRFEDI